MNCEALLTENTHLLLIISSFLDLRKQIISFISLKYLDKSIIIKQSKMGGRSSRGHTVQYRTPPQVLASIQQSQAKIQQLQQQQNNAKVEYQKSLSNQRQALQKQNQLEIANKISAMQLEQQKKTNQLTSQINRIKYQNETKIQKLQSESQARIQKLQSQSQARIKLLQKQLESINDPQKINQHVARMKQLFWSDLKNQQFNIYKGKSAIFVGRTSVGKSSLLNTLFKTRLPTSKASCTKQISIIYTFGRAQDNNLISIFDCPGLDQHFDLLKDPYKIPKYMGPISDIYYLYDSIIQEDIIKTFMAMKKKIFLVRTKCDPDQDPEENQQVRAKDQSALSKIGLQTKIYFTSKKGGEDNQKLLQDMMSIS